MSRNIVAGILFVVLLQYFVMLNVIGKWIDIASKRPTYQSSTQTPHQASYAVDGNTETCSSTRDLRKQMWMVDLEMRAWVEYVLIESKRELPNVDIRIGDQETPAFESNPLCRQGLQVPKNDDMIYGCAEPMLGKYVYISIDYNGAATLELCDVKVFVNGDAIDGKMTYLLPTSYGRHLVQGKFWKSEKSDQFVFKVVTKKRAYSHRSYRKDVIIDLPPRKEMLKNNAPIVMPLEPSLKSYKEDKCSPKNYDVLYLNGTILEYSKDKGVVVVKSVYIPLRERRTKKMRERMFHCSIKDLRMKRADICDFPNKCGASVGSHCDKTFISSSFPPGAYHCKCNVGFVPSPSSKLRMDNHVNPGERCIRKPEARFQIEHSNQNLALAMRVTASSTDNFDGCKKKYCKEVYAFGLFVTDGSLRTYFLSLNEYKPWLIVHLDDYRLVSYVRVTASTKFSLERLSVFVGEIKESSSHFRLCGFRREMEKGQQLSFGCNDYLFVNAVKITTYSRILSLCEVEVYSHSYANVALQPISKHKKSLKNDGNLQSCYTKTGTEWSLDLGNNIRVAVVFILHDHSTYLEGSEITVGYSGKKEICATIPKYKGSGNYFECQQPVIGNKLKVTSKRRGTFKLCEVEVFQTKTVNLAGKRPAKATVNNHDAYRGCDQKIDKSFSIKKEGMRIGWYVDLIAECKVHLVRIVTSKGYKPADLKGLKVVIGTREDSLWSKERRVASLDFPTAKSVQTIILPKETRGRFVGLTFEKAGVKLQFLEVEIYNGPLLVVDVCKKPDICGHNYKCVNGKKIHSCICPSGFQITGRYKECKDIDECASSNACPRHIKNSYCKNTAGSYKCFCKEGYEAVTNPEGNLRTCRDIDECSNPSLNECNDRTICVNNIGGYTCKCAVGYESDKGGKATGIDIKCKDVDECSSNIDACHAKATCSNTIGSYKCTCLQGLRGDGRLNCLKMQPCSINKPCMENEVCKDFGGLRLCDCKRGYHIKDKSCVETNECNEDKSICGSNSVCTNTRGSYHCNCEVGFESKMDDGKNCTDRDECQKKNPCGGVATCENTEGSYHCSCTEGFTFDRKTKQCVDADECIDVYTCSAHMACENTFGSFSCTCRHGYRLDKSSQNCTDIDECEEDDHNCTKFSKCRNLIGAYECRCKGGYQKTLQGACKEICIPACGANSYCEKGKCLCLKGYSLGPDFTCEAGFLGSSGVSLPSRDGFLIMIATLLLSLVLRNLS
ncbi:uncharacterized protein LOC111343471 [Stylophora pistillata]|uniref:uncharacterized protein LOC111343471 n=1 Tax=Stylophora pistillata TaxID=50429 RepID=UPI000C052268|nr:uncharacterized protein LOC111343471 [Stylophora pistillata]